MWLSSRPAPVKNSRTEVAGDPDVFPRSVLDTPPLFSFQLPSTPSVPLCPPVGKWAGLTRCWTQCTFWLTLRIMVYHNPQLFYCAAESGILQDNQGNKDRIHCLARHVQPVVETEPITCDFPVARLRSRIRGLKWLATLMFSPAQFLTLRLCFRSNCPPPRPFHCAHPSANGPV